mgnify:FL=1|tara:strand:- start:625 stop:1002 length:378 start_codon:yes stop_codon:yes gene_type:complete
MVVREWRNKKQTEEMLRIFAVTMLRTLDSANLSNGIARKMADLICNAGLSVTEAMEYLLEVTPMTNGPKRSDMLYFEDYVKYCEHCDTEYLVNNPEGCIGALPSWMDNTIEKGRYCSAPESHHLR